VSDSTVAAMRETKNIDADFEEFAVISWKGKRAKFCMNKF
jgi:hypothetical protein